MRANGHDVLGGAGDAEKPATQVKIQDVGGKLGWRIRYEWNEQGVAFVAWKIEARQTDGLKLAFFAKSGAPAGTFTPDPVAAEPLLSGAIKPDGRVLFWGGTAVMMGAVGLKFHLALQKEIWFTAHQLLGRSNDELRSEWRDAGG